MVLPDFFHAYKRHLFSVILVVVIGSFLAAVQNYKIIVISVKNLRIAKVVVVKGSIVEVSALIGLIE